MIEYKLKDTVSKNAFNYGYLVRKIAPYIKPVWSRVMLNILIAVPLGLLDGVVAFSLKPYMDMVINGSPEDKWMFLGHAIPTQAFLAALIPFAVVAFVNIPLFPVSIAIDIPAKINKTIMYRKLLMVSQ